MAAGREASALPARLRRSLRAPLHAFRGRLARASLGSFVLKGAGTLLAFAYSLVLARLLGAAQYGVYEVVIAWVMMLAVPAVFGFDKLLVRVLPAAVVRGDLSHARGLQRWSTTAVLALSGAIALGAAIVARTVGGGTVPPPAFWIGCLALPLVALAILWEGALRGLHRIVEGQAAIVIVRPLVALALVVTAIATGRLPATAVTALSAFAVAAFVAVVTSGALLALRTPRELRRAGRSYTPRRWIAVAVPIMVMSGLTIANGRVGTILVGGLVDAEAAGVFSVLIRGTDLIAFALVAVNAAVAPAFAALHAERDRERFQRVVTRSARLIFVLSLPIALGLLLFGDVYLQAFGPSFTTGLAALRVVTLGQLVNVAMGSVGVLLVMTGHERVATLGFAAALVVNVAGCLLLVPHVGIVGAAWATTLSIVVWNGVLAVLVHRRLGIDATLLGFARGPRGAREGTS